jgi:hypothetical protein
MEILNKAFKFEGTKLDMIKSFVLQPIILVILVFMVYIKELFVSVLSSVEIYPLLKSVFDV